MRDLHFYDAMVIKGVFAFVIATREFYIKVVYLVMYNYELSEYIHGIVA